jgi:prevent-host-death family protein
MSLTRCARVATTTHGTKVTSPIVNKVVPMRFKRPSSNCQPEATNSGPTVVQRAAALLAHGTAAFDRLAPLAHTVIDIALDRALAAAVDRFAAEFSWCCSSPVIDSLGITYIKWPLGCTVATMDVGVTDLRANLSEWLERARNGEEVVVTERGIPVVRLIPIATATKIEQLQRDGVISPATGSKRPVAKGRYLIAPKGSVSELVAEQRG